MMSSSAHAHKLEMLRIHIQQQASEELYFYQVSCEGSTNYGSKGSVNLRTLWSTNLELHAGTEQMEKTSMVLHNTSTKYT